ncbi:MAG: hypothetical protein LBV74_03155 [Tannerella sp.]|nr:hypothetical protein [Tannerella sp.]
MKNAVLLIISLAFFACGNPTAKKEHEAKEKSIEQNAETTSFVELQNPILPGYFADPSIVQYEGKFYMYVTADPWGRSS